MDESWENYAKQIKPVIERQVLHEFNLHDIPRTVKIQRQKVEWWLPGAGKERGIESCCLMGANFSFTRGREFWRWVSQQCDVPNTIKLYT